jgi:hypothetical protein
MPDLLPKEGPGARGVVDLMLDAGHQLLGLLRGGGEQGAVTVRFLEQRREGEGVEHLNVELLGPVGRQEGGDRRSDRPSDGAR